MNCCQRPLKIVIIKKHATNQNSFIQQVSTNTGKKAVSHRGDTFWANVENASKINLLISSANNAEHFCYCNIYKWSKSLLHDIS